MTMDILYLYKSRAIQGIYLSYVSTIEVYYMNLICIYIYILAQTV